MKKLETLSDTVFEKGLSEILSSDSETEDESTESQERPILTFPETSQVEKKRPIISELLIRILASIAALILLIYFVLNVSSKF